MSQEIASSSETPIFTDQLVDARQVTQALGLGLTKWWEGVKAGTYPKPIKLGNRCTRWKKSEIERLIQNGVSGLKEAQ